MTSRVPLHLRWEQTLRVSPLAVPDLDSVPQLDELVRIPSVALFLDRSQAQRADFTLTEEQAPLVAQLSVQLDGLPLAIELAAARMNVLPLAVIAGRLEDRLQLLQWDAADLPDRHRSLHAAIDWSYELLTDAEQQLFRHVGVFVGRVSLDAIEAVVGEEDEGATLARMASLAEKSLVLPGQQEDDEREPSFGILETVREYAWEQLLEYGELEDAGRAHAQYFVELAERADPQLRMRGQLAWFFRLEHEHDNLRAALRWLLDHGSTDLRVREAALRLANALGHFWWLRGYHAEGGRWLEEALRSAPDADPAIRTQALLRRGVILTYQGEFDRSRVVLEEALALAQQRHDRRDIAESLTYLGVRAVFVEELTEGVRLLQEALDRWQELGELGDQFHIGTALRFLGVAAFMQGDYEQAASLLSASVARHQAIGGVHTAGGVRFYLALIVRELGDLPRAAQLLQEGIQVSMTLQDRYHLSIGVDAALLLIGDRATREKRARLLGARDALYS